LFGETIGIDLGSSYTRIYMKGQGVVLCEPTVAAVEGGKILSIGAGADEMIGRTPRNIRAIRPISHGVISDLETTEKIIKYFVKKACGNRLFKPSAVISVPGEISEVCERAVIDAAIGAGIKSAELTDIPIAAAIGAGADIGKPCGSMICDIGSEKTDIAVISMGGIVLNAFTKTAGASFDEVISDFIKKEKRVAIGEKAAENVKIAIGSLDGEGDKVSVRGRCLVSGLPKSVEISAEEIMPSLKEKAMDIVYAVLSVLENTPPQLLSDISDSGIILCGGGANLKGIDKTVFDFTGIKCIVAEMSDECTIKGLGKIIENEVEEINKAL